MDGGATFPNVVKNLSSNPTTSEHPVIAVSGNNIHVVWENGFAPLEIEISSIEDLLMGEVRFPNIIKNISNTPRPSLNPDMATLGNNIYVVWNEDSWPQDIVHKKRYRWWTRLLNPTTNIVENPDILGRPSITVS